MTPVRGFGVAAAACVGVTLATACVLVGWLAVVAGAGAGVPSVAGGCDSGLRASVPERLRPIFRAAAERYELGENGAAVLAGLTSVESDFGRNMGPSSAGAIGWTQFLPSTWASYGVDADGDGRADPFNAHDAIHGAANYLRASGAPDDWRRALFAYNHADWYVAKVLREARRLAAPGPATPCASLPSDGARRIEAPAGIVGIPGQPGERIDSRLLPNVLWLVARFRVRVTDGYAPSGHAADGEHPLGLAVDLVPGREGTWDDVDRLARWAEPRQGQPRPPFRWVGYDGDANHGRGHHLHLSWNHAPTPSRRPFAAWVEVLFPGR